MVRGRKTRYKHSERWELTSVGTAERILGDSQPAVLLLYIKIRYF